MPSKLDAYNFQVVTRYFFFRNDFTNSILVCKKFCCILDRFRYNPIPISSKRLFPYMETQHLYTKYDVKIPNINNFVVWYKVDYSNSKNLIKDNNWEFKNVRITLKDIKSLNITNFDDMKKILKNKSIKILGNHLFTSFNIKEYVLPVHVTKLEKNLFIENSSIKSVTLCDGIRSISNCCFKDCIQLTSINFPSSVSSFKYDSFANCGFESFSMPDTIYSVGCGALENCRNLKDVVVSQNVRTIHATFYYCTNLTRVDLPSNLNEISYDSFMGCVNLKRITIPDTVRFVFNHAFEDCLNLQELIFNENCFISNSVFDGCTSLTKFVVPTFNDKVLNGISSGEIDIYKKFYTDFKDIDEEYINMDRVDYCGDYDDNEGIFVLSNNIQNIYPRLFDGKENMRKLYNTDQVTLLKKNCFSSCKFLEEITFKKDVKIESGCFENCTSLTKLELSNDNMKVRFTPTFQEIKILDTFGYKYDKVLFEFSKEDIDYFNDIKKCNYLVELSGHVKGKNKIQKIKIPHNVISIQDEFFHESKFKSIDLGNVRQIGDNIFGPKLLHITIPTTLTQIGKNVLDDCKNLKSIDLCGKKTFDGFVNIKTMRRLNEINVICKNVCVPMEMLAYFKNFNIKLKKSTVLHLFSNFVVPQNVLSISEKCFLNCYNLKEVVLPSTLTSIEKMAFFNCYSIKTLNLPDSLKMIGSCAFENCGLTSISIPTSVTQIGEPAFLCCRDLKTVVIPDIIVEYCNVFEMCPLLSHVEIVKTREIGLKFNSTFGDICFNLKNINIPNNVTSIKEKSFSNFLTLTKISIGKCVEQIGKSCFENCENLKEIEIPSSVTYIANFAFKNCSKLVQIKFTKQVTDVSPTAFEKCDKLTEIFIENKIVTTVDFPVTYEIAQMFKTNSIYCNNVIFFKSDIIRYLKIKVVNGKRIGEIPKGVVKLSEQCFRGYKEVDVIRIPNSTQKIGDFCFYHSPIKQVFIIDNHSFITTLKFWLLLVWGKCKTLNILFLIVICSGIFILLISITQQNNDMFPFDNDN
ncbi:hypothetical protein EIN_144460 [Entamoeba invadens IP1]|uniref:Leucine rich repeat containing protein BspA family protein n=1 Tax=Entamoeba invadens IP1 TaxID=370355 RepID=A0A0A1UF96_ENTIV|nr:hypothetical protein EIN_144460 [Entamoeba invadens IP1]ELP91486.1 hypothetical protein EIN_144460 [Entamoeba invadens IP1]|eukprot:XP_004258257.1 hypothetical protein EIN_144460 [Entamoeba invadens IP1]